MAMDLLELRAKIALDIDEYEKGLDNAEKDAQGFGSKLKSGLATAGKLAVKGLAVATGAVTAFGAKSVAVGQDFDKSMSQVAATMGLTMDEMVNQTGKVELAWGSFSGNLREYAQEMGKNTAFSATEAADALNYMALAGYDAQQSMEMLPNVLNLAAAGNMDLARASDMVTDTQTAFGLKMEEMPQLIDEMAKAASTGNTSVEQLGDAFLVVGGLAQDLNGGMVTLADGTQKPVSGIQEMEIALTAMANAGVKGSEAGTHMRNMLMKLSSPTDAGVKAMEELGVSVFDTEGNMRSLSDIFGDLSTSMESLTQEEKLNAISDLFNARDIASAEAILNAVNQDWDAIGESILNADGAAQKMADTQLDNLSGDITLFKSALEGAQIAVSDGLTPTLREFVQFGTEGLGKLTTAFQEGGISGAMSALGEILSSAVQMIIEKLPAIVEAAMSLLSAFAQGLIDNLPMLVTSAMQIIQSLSGYLVEALPEMIPAIVDILLEIVDTLIDNIDMLVDCALQLIMALADGIIKALPKLLEKAPILVVKLVAAIIKNLPKIIGAGVELVLAIIEGITSMVSGLVNCGQDVVNWLKNGFDDKVQAAKKWGQDLIDNFVNGIKERAKRLTDAVKGVAEKVKALLGFSEPEEGPLSDFHTYAPDMIDLFVKGLNDSDRKLRKAVGATADIIADGMQVKSVDASKSASYNSTKEVPVFNRDINVNLKVGSNQFGRAVITANQLNAYRSGGF